MKRIARALCLIPAIASFMGCYMRIPFEESRVPVEFKVVSLDEPQPAQDEVDIVITTHIKKASYLLSPRTAKTPYTFALLINGQELKEEVKGIEEVESDMDTEKGKGIHYVLKQRFRFKPGIYRITLRPEDSHSAKVKIQIDGGRVYTLRFEPVYGPIKFGLMKTFRQGVIGYKVYLDGNEIQRIR